MGKAENENQLSTISCRETTEQPGFDFQPETLTPALPDRKENPDWRNNLISQNEPAWPRPYVQSKDGQSLPAPWVGETTAKTIKDFAQIDSDQIIDIYNSRGRICDVCGCEIKKNWVYARIPEEVLVKPDQLKGFEAVSGGTGMHARCALIAAKACPHFREKQAQNQLDNYFYVSKTRPAIHWDASMQLSGIWLPKEINSENAEQRTFYLKENQGYVNSESLRNMTAGILLDKKLIKEASLNDLRSLAKNPV
jgi:hypothetical protein